MTKIDGYSKYLDQRWKSACDSNLMEYLTQKKNSLDRKSASIVIKKLREKHGYYCGYSNAKRLTETITEGEK